MVGTIALLTSLIKCSLKNFRGVFHFVCLSQEQRWLPSQFCLTFLVLRTKTLVQESRHSKSSHSF